MTSQTLILIAYRQYGAFPYIMSFNVYGDIVEENIQCLFLENSFDYEHLSTTLETVYRLKCPLAHES